MELEGPCGFGCADLIPVVVSATAGIVLNVVGLVGFQPTASRLVADSSMR